MSVDRAREIYRELQKLARADYRGTTGSLLVVYGVEGFLRRLAASEYATKLTLKGGMLMAASATRRMTKDADLSAVGVANDPEHVARIVADILTVELPDNDGLEFDVGTIRTEVMREHADYTASELGSRAASPPRSRRSRSTSHSVSRTGRWSSISRSSWAAAASGWRPIRPS